jgi:SAM-dependent methyltransferase
VNKGYLAYHAPRFRFLLELVQQYLPRSATRALDIGPSPFSDLLRDRLTCPVDTLGLELEDAGQSGRVHHHADLNAPGSIQNTPQRYDLIVFAEVLEHLHTSPAVVLAALRSLLTQDGILILQTPNAASFPKRLKLLAGWNPYELIRVDQSNPGHFREYTLSELLRYAEQTNLEVVSRFRRSYFDARHADHEDGAVGRHPVVGTLKNLIYRYFPPPLREGLTLVLRKR